MIRAGADPEKITRNEKIAHENTLMRQRRRRMVEKAKPMKMRSKMLKCVEAKDFKKRKRLDSGIDVE